MKQKFDGSVIWKKGGFEFETIIRKMYVLIVLWIAHGVAVTYPNRPWMDIFADLHYKFVPASATHICIYILYTYIYIIYYIYIFIYIHTQARTAGALYDSIRKTTRHPKIHKITFPRVMTIIVTMLSWELPEIVSPNCPHGIDTLHYTNTIKFHVLHFTTVYNIISNHIMACYRIKIMVYSIILYYVVESCI